MVEIRAELDAWRWVPTEGKGVEEVDVNDDESTL
jgi:hypothetical protein